MTTLAELWTTFAALPSEPQLCPRFFRMRSFRGGGVDCFKGTADFCSFSISPYAPLPVRVFAPDAVFTAMLGIGQQFKIIQTVVRSVLILVVNMLVPLQKAAKVLLHDQPVFKNVSAKGLGVFGRSDADVTVAISKPSTASPLARTASNFSVFLSSLVNSGRRH